MFSESELNEIRARLNIVELVQEYVQLKKAGQGYLGLCPFHGEKTPSFHVHPLKQCFHCFGCHKGGNIFTFMCALEGLSFPDAVKRLAKRTGVTLEERGYQKAKKFKPIIVGEKRLLEALEWATKYFQHLLLKVPEYRFALDYLNSRGITEKTIQKFRIGVSPKGWNTLLTLMTKRRFAVDELVQAGLTIKREDSSTQGYDRFRGRLMFPITNLEGEIIGFGGRQLLEGENQPKYLNSPESPLFAKRQVLYGLFENQRGVRLSGEAVLVEGYMDVVGLFECGVMNAVATMGTAATEEHCEQLRALTRRVVTVFDPDRAGNDAWHRSVHLFLGAGIFAKDLTLPDGMDPDEFVQKEGAEKFRELCEKAPRQVTKLLKEIASKGSLSEEQRGQILQELTPVLVASRRLPDRPALWDNIALVLKVSLNALKDIVERATSGPGGQQAAAGNEKRHLQASVPAVKAKKLNPLDMEFFQACLLQPEAFLGMAKEDWLAGIREPLIRTWLEKLCLATDSSHFDRLLGECVQGNAPETLLNLASERLLNTGAEGSNPATPFEVVAERIRGRKKEAEIQALSAQVRLTESMGDGQEQLRLLQRLKELRSQ